MKDIYAAAFGTRNFNSVLVDLMAETGRQGMLLNLLLLQLWVTVNRMGCDQTNSYCTISINAFFTTEISLLLNRKEQWKRLLPL